MNASKHTPGSWKYYTSDYGIDICGEERHVAGESWYPRVFAEGTPEREEKEANARLIATAPEMYEMLKHCIQPGNLQALSDYWGPGYADGFEKEVKTIFAKVEE